MRRAGESREHPGWCGPHALACAAALPCLVTRCAVVGSTSPPDTSGPCPVPEEHDVRRDLTSWIAVREGEPGIRPRVEAVAAQIMAGIGAGGPELPPDPDDPGAAAGPAADDPAAVARVRATFVDSHDGWVDDLLALARPWGFALADIAVPVSLWWGTRDGRGRGHASWLGAAIPHAERDEYPGGHLQPSDAYEQMLRWLGPTVAAW